MRHKLYGIPVFYRDKQIFTEVDDIIESYDIKNYHNVSFSDKLKICGLLINHENKNNCSDWMDALIDAGVVKSITGPMISGCYVDYIDRAIKIDESIVSHYENLMEEIFNERIEHVETSKKEPRYCD